MDEKKVHVVYQVEVYGRKGFHFVPNGSSADLEKVKKRAREIRDGEDVYFTDYVRKSKLFKVSIKKTTTITEREYVDF